jgi:hypothetical protein
MSDGNCSEMAGIARGYDVAVAIICEQCGYDVSGIPMSCAHSVR